MPMMPMLVIGGCGQVAAALGGGHVTGEGGEGAVDEIGAGQEVGAGLVTPCAVALAEVGVGH